MENRGDTGYAHRMFDGFVRKCGGCGKVCDCALVGVYEKTKTLKIFSGLRLDHVEAVCKECSHAEAIPLEEVRENAMPLVYQKIKSGAA